MSISRKTNKRKDLTADPLVRDTFIDDEDCDEEEDEIKLPTIEDRGGTLQGRNRAARHTRPKARRRNTRRR